MITEEIRDEEETYDKVPTVKKTCKTCDKRVRVQPSRVTCPICHTPFVIRKKVIKEQRKAEKVAIRAEKKEKKEKVKKENVSKVVVKKPSSEKKTPSFQSDDLFYIKSKRGADAKAKITVNGICIIKGSSTAPDWVTSTPEPVKKMGKRLREIEEGIIINDRFVKDYTFKSSSMAAAIVMGRSANGLKEWRNIEGKTLKELK